MCSVSAGTSQRAHTLPHHLYRYEHVQNTHLHSFIISALTCLWVCLYICVSVHVHHMLLCPVILMQVLYLFLFQASRASCAVRLLHLRGLVIIAAQIGSRRVCLLLSEACVQPDVSVTYFIIGSNQHQSPGRRGRCRWLLCARLPCLSERLCQVHVNLEKKEKAELPSRVNAALCSLQYLTPPYPSNKWSVKQDVSLCCTLCAEYISVSVCSPVHTHSAQMPSLCFARKKEVLSTMSLKSCCSQYWDGEAGDRSFRKPNVDVHAQ